ncbi:MAG: GNAT family N-acetyltransferase [Firmicutes bacterium]|jgi:GNAT superfamily N-acetyltransferase|nr:GNAT family N-acetyltransferase [Bacillota bacterium]MDH7495482.1 GNAT family N-acetyltransferase [Bacillota bacterium]
MRIRKATPADAPILARVHVDTWRATYKGIIADSYLARLDYRAGEDRWKASLASLADAPDSDSSRGLTVLVAEHEVSGVVGFAAGGPNRDTEIEEIECAGELHAIYVLPEHQRKGVGRMLVAGIAKSLLEAGLHSMAVWVLAANPFREFYEDLGAREIKRNEIEIGGQQYDAVLYAWSDLDMLSRSLQQA